MENIGCKVVFIDVGGILLTNGWGHESRLLASKEFGLNYEELEVLHNFTFSIYEMGHITLDEYLDTVVFNHERNFGHEEFKKFMFEQSKELPDMLEWLKEWKKSCGFRVISISNEVKELNDYRNQKFKLHDCFDAFITSCEVQMRKPDPAIYKLAMGVAMVRPEECIYLDDRIMLVNAAEKLGIRSHHHTDFESTKLLLKSLKKA
jgi:putative hydrolase of the HAD superfamily